MRNQSGCQIQWLVHHGVLAAVLFSLKTLSLFAGARIDLVSIRTAQFGWNLQFNVWYLFLGFIKSRKSVFSEMIIETVLI